MKPAPKPIIVRYKKLGRERVLGIADLDTHVITIDPRQPSRELIRAHVSWLLDVGVRHGAAFCKIAAS